jgi:uncharacterized protein (TIGR00730 family)
MDDREEFAGIGFFALDHRRVLQMLVEASVAAAIAGKPVGQEMGPGHDVRLEEGAEFGTRRGWQHGDPGVAGEEPQSLVEREVAHTGLDDLRVVGSIHERKALMVELSDAFVALPGGVGTLEEIFEVWTWGQLGSHSKPCAFLNTQGFYNRLLDFLDHVVEEAFLKPGHDPGRGEARRAP